MLIEKKKISVNTYIAHQSYPLLHLGGVLKQDFKHAFNLNLTQWFFSSAKHKGESRSKTTG